MSEIAPISREDLLTALDRLQSPAVLVHKNPDGDAVGSAVALVRYLRGRGVEAALLSPDPIPARLAFLTEGVPLFEGTPREIVTVDVASLSQAGRLADTVTGAEQVYMIDHHEMSVPYAPHYIRPEDSAVGEVLYDLLSSGGTQPLPAEIAAPLYAAIASDTGSFRFANVTPKTHRAAAGLLACGIPAEDICHRLFDLHTEGELRAIAYAIGASTQHHGGRFSMLALSRAALSDIGCTDADFDGVIDTVRSRRGVEVAALIRERADGSVRLSLRTTGADAASLCASFGGGGHRVAAGCTLPVATAEEGAALLLSRIGCLFDENGQKS